jgi:hypothetical protein
MSKEEPLTKGEFAMLIAHLKSWGLLLIVGIVVVALLGQMPTLDHGLQQRRQAIAVFQPLKVRMLTDDNLVDALTKLPLQDPLMKVSWDHAILTVDLLAVEPDAVWEDIGHLVAFSYSEVHNVKQVLIRIFKNRGENRTLLLAAETRKSEWTEKEITTLQPSTLWVDPNYRERIRLSLTPSGKRWISNFAN